MGENAEMLKKKMFFANDSQTHTVLVMMKIHNVDVSDIKDLFYAWDVSMDLPISYEIIDKKPYMHFIDATEESSILDYMLKVKRASMLYNRKMFGSAYDMFSEVQDAADNIVYEALNDGFECEFF
jgi:hypothetical protein